MDAYAMTPDRIAVAVNYLRPMATPTNMAVTGDPEADVSEVADTLVEALAQNSIRTVRIVLGDDAPALSDDEIIDLLSGEPQVVVVEIQPGAPRTKSHFLQAAYCDRIGDRHFDRNAATSVVFAQTGYRDCNLQPVMKDSWVINRTVHFGLKLPVAA